MQTQTAAPMLFSARLCLLALAMPVAALPLAAQTASQPADPSKEATVVLDPFSVEGSAYNGYTATRSSTGTRVAADIKDLPYTIDVTPIELWDDFALLTFNQQETLSTVAGVSASESNGEYQLRGLPNGQFYLRNGFLRFGRVDQSNVERFEVIKGPAGAIYGKTLPGGIINAIPKTAKAAPEYSLEIQAGTLDLYRAALSATGPLLPGALLYRVDASTTHEKAFEEFRSNKLNSLSGQLAWLPARRTRGTLEFDYGREFRGGRDGLDEARDKQTAQFKGLGWNFPNYRTELNTSSSPTFSDFINREANATVVHRFNDVFSLRLAGNWHYFGLTTVRGRGVWDPDDNLVWSRRPDLGFENRHGHAINLDLLSEFKAAGTQHHLLTTVDFVRDQRELGPTYRLNATKYRTATGYPGNQLLKEFSAAGADPNPYPPLADFDALFRDQNSINTTLGFLVNDRVALLDNRLIASLGGRYDRIHQVTADLLAGKASDTNVDARTVQSGLNYHLTPEATLYASYSTSFNPQTVLDPSGKPFPNQKGAGYEAGVKLGLLGNQLFATANYFDITYHNIVQQETGPTGATIFTLNGEIRSKGAELSAGGKLWNALTVKFGLGYTDAVIVDNQVKALIGLLPRKVPNWNLGAAFKYEFQNEALKGAYVGTNVTAVSNVRYSDSTPAIRFNSYLPGWTRWDFLAGCTWRSGNKRWRYTTSLVVKNAFDRVYATGGDPTFGNPRQFVLRHSMAFK